jgi:hypothetical protein
MRLPNPSHGGLRSNKSERDNQTQGTKNRQRSTQKSRAEIEGSKQRKKKRMVRVEDMMEIAGADPFNKALSFIVVGDPPVQKRH